MVGLVGRRALIGFAVLLAFAGSSVIVVSLASAARANSTVHGRPPGARPSSPAARASSSGQGRKRSRRHHKRKHPLAQSPARPLAPIPLAAPGALPVLLGDAALEAHRDFLPGGQAAVFQMKTGSGGPGALIHVYVGSGTGAKTLAVGLYGDSHGRPGALLATATAPVSRTAAWVRVGIPPVELSSGRSIWVAILGVGGGLRFRDRSQGPCAAETSQQTTLNGLPSHWRMAALNRRCPASVYLTSLELASPPGSRTEPHRPGTPPGSQPTARTGTASHA